MQNPDLDLWVGWNFHGAMPEVLTLIRFAVTPVIGLSEIWANGHPYAAGSVGLFERSLDQMSKLDDLLKSLRSEKLRKANDVSAKQQRKKIPNVISEETGQYDARFMLWRRFCSENHIPVETLPSDLSHELQQKWDELKNRKLS